MTDAVGTVRMHHPGGWLSCWTFDGDRTTHDETIDRCIATHPDQRIYATWSYRAGDKHLQDNTVYTPESGRVDCLRRDGILHIPDGPITLGHNATGRYARRNQ